MTSNEQPREFSLNFRTPEFQILELILLGSSGVLEVVSYHTHTPSLVVKVIHHEWQSFNSRCHYIAFMGDVGRVTAGHLLLSKILKVYNAERENWRALCLTELNMKIGQEVSLH